jgi:hypothetical protein
MKFTEILAIVEGKTFTNEKYLPDIQGCFGADLMSDVLATVLPDAVLLTGLCNPQVVRTAVMADIRAIIFVRGKMPTPETLQLAEAEGIPLISSPLGMFEVCGRLYSAGLPSLEGSRMIGNNPCH